MHVLLLVYTPVLLFVDGRTASRESQLALGLLTFVVLVACVRRLDAAGAVADVDLRPGRDPVRDLRLADLGRLPLPACSNIPLYVPPGHALVYVFGITAGALPLVRSSPEAFTHAVLALATVWTVAGLTVLPLTRTPPRPARRRAVAALRVVHPALEAADDVRRDLGRDRDARDRRHARRRLDLGRGCAVEPPRAGNPPSAIAAGYAVIDGSVALVAGLARGGVAGSGADRAASWLAPNGA